MTSKTLVPKISACTLALVAAGFGLTACGSSESGSASSDTVSPAADSSVSSASSAPSSAASSAAAASGASAQAGQGTKTVAQGADVSCTNQINYAGDPRSNAEINSIGAETGTCPAVEEPASSSGKPAGSASKKDRACRTKDLKLTVAEESQAGGYYLVTASARPGVSCVLPGITASAAFGSSPDSAAGPAEQSTSASIRLSGTTKAYAGVSPKTTADNNGVEYPQIILSVSASDPDPISIALSSPATVDRPVATNWHSSAGDAVPLGGGTDQ
ncbi:MAG: hypothetical protein J2O46_10700 [Nocardioides sp.]|nr:hypothetical protein [Nocardioides sp.]